MENTSKKQNTKQSTLRKTNSNIKKIAPIKIKKEAPIKIKKKSIGELKVFSESYSISVKDEMKKIYKKLITEIKSKYMLSGKSKIKIVPVLIEKEGRILISAHTTKTNGTETTQSDALFNLR